MGNSITIKEFRQLISKIGREYAGWQCNELAKAIVDKLNTTSNPNKDEQQNILNSKVKESITDLLILHLPEKFDYDRYYFSKQVINKLPRF